MPLRTLLTALLLLCAPVVFAKPVKVEWRETKY